MEGKIIQGRLKQFLHKYRYATIVLLIGLILLMLPERKTQTQITTPQSDMRVDQNAIEPDSLVEILESIDGAGKVKVLLSVAKGAETLYQTDSDISISESGESRQIDTVLISDSQRTQTGLVRQTNPQTYLGAVVVCQGADSASVRLAVCQAVSKITGLGADAVCVLKMK